MSWREWCGGSFPTSSSSFSQEGALPGLPVAAGVRSGASVQLFPGFLPLQRLLGFSTLSAGQTKPVQLVSLEVLIYLTRASLLQSCPSERHIYFAFCFSFADLIKDFSPCSLTL